jgi:hypothetical protein
MPPVGFEPTIPASARPQTHTLDRAATGIGRTFNITMNIVHFLRYSPFLQRHDVSEVDASPFFR